MEIDEKTRLRHEYVRMKIACRDVTKVPRIAEGTLGLSIHDFIFEREIQAEENVRILSSGIKVGDSDTQPSQKKFKGDIPKPKQIMIASVKSQDGGYKSRKQSTSNVCMSAPPKVMNNGNSDKVEITKLKAREPVDDSEDRVHIPEDFEDSDAESGTLSEKIRKLEGYGDVG